MNSIFLPIVEEMEKRIINAFAGKLAIVRGYPDDKNLTKVPALFIEMVSLDDVEPIGTGESEMVSRWELRVVISKKQANALTVAMDAAATLGNLLADKVLAAHAYEAKFLGATDDNFDRKVTDVESWMVELSIKVRVGSSDWDKFEFYEEYLHGIPLQEVTG